MGPAGPQHRWAPAPVDSGPGLAQQRARLGGRGHLDQLGEVLVDHGLDFGSVSALSESNSKSACAFP